MSTAARTPSYQGACVQNTGRAPEQDHVQYVPRWSSALTSAQVTGFPPEVCKTVGFAFPGSNPGPATTSERPVTGVPGSRADPSRSGPPSRRGGPCRRSRAQRGQAVDGERLGRIADDPTHGGARRDARARRLAGHRVNQRAAGGAGLPCGAPAKLRVIAHPHGRPRPRRRSCRVSHH